MDGSSPTSSGNATFAAVCAVLQARLDRVPSSPVRTKLLSRVNELRSEVESWADLPASSERRPQLASALLSVQREVEELTTSR